MAGPTPQSFEPFVLCFAKQRWSDSWNEISLLNCTRLTDSAAPGHGTGSFEWEYGAAQWPAVGTRAADGPTVHKVVPRADCNGCYVRADFLGGSWWGIFREVRDSRNGVIEFPDKSGTYVDTGTQSFSAFALSVLLDERPVSRSIVELADDSLLTIGKALPVNGGTDGRLSPDRVATPNKAPGANRFSASDAAEYWTARAFIQYLLEFFRPEDVNGQAHIPFSLKAGDELNYRLPYFDYTGQTIWSILNHLISRRRGLGFRVLITNNEVEIRTFSYSPVNVVLPSGITIPPNINQASLDLSLAINVNREELTETRVNRYDVVNVIGDYYGSVCTLEQSSGAEQAWTPEEKTEFDTAESQASDYTDASDEDRATWDEVARRSDHLEKVYSWWSIPSDWNQKVSFEDAEYFVFPVPNANAQVNFDASGAGNGAVAVWNDGMRIGDFLPMKLDVDYREEVTPDTGADSLAEFRRTPVWLDHVLAEHLDHEADSEAIPDPRTWNVSTYTQKDAPGLILEVNGAPQQYICADIFEHNGPHDEIFPEVQPLNSDDWVATVYLRSQERAQAWFPALGTIAESDNLRVFEYFMPDAHFDVIVPGTIVGVERTDGGSGSGSSSGAVFEYVRTKGGILRSDYTEMADAAKMIFYWVGIERNILNVGYSAASYAPPIGTLYTQLKSSAESLPVDVNTVVTKSEVTFGENGGVTFETSAAEIEIAEGA